MDHEGVNTALTIIQAKFRPSDELNQAIGEYYERPPSGEVSVFASASRYVDRYHYYHSAYDLEIRAAEARLRELGRNAIRISGATRLLRLTNGNARLVMEPANQEHFDAILDSSLNMIDTYNWHADSSGPHHLYTDISIKSLAGERERRLRAAKEFAARADDPIIARRMTVREPRLVVREVIVPMQQRSR